MNEVRIIGAGVAGLCTARCLLDAGLPVTVIDRQAEPGAGACSWWAGGMLAPFCEGEAAEEPVQRLGQLAADWWAKQTISLHRNGTLVLSTARDLADLKRFARRTTGHVAADSALISQLEPDLDGRFSNGLFFKDEAHLTPRTALHELRAGLLADGAKFDVAEVDPEAFTDGITVDCRGFGARAQVKDLRGVKGEMLILRCPDMSLSRPVRLLHPRIPLYIVPRGDGVFMLGATQIEGRAGDHVSARALLELLSAAYALHPAFAEAEVLEIGVDSRPAFADNLPRVRRSGNLIRANGLFRHGFLLAPALAQNVTDVILNNAQPEMMDEPAA